MASWPRWVRRLLAACAVTAVTKIALVVASRAASRHDEPSPAPTEEHASAPRHMQKEPGACAVVFDDGEAHVSEEAIRLALLAGPAIDCRGHSYAVRAARATPRIVVTLVKGDDVEVDDAGLGASVVARVGVGPGEASSPCASDVGLIAILTLRGARLAADAIGDWTAPCGPGASEALTLMRVGREHVLLEEDGDSNDVEERTFDRAWVRRGERLVHAGDVVTSVTRESSSMTATLSSAADALVATETWTGVSGPDTAARVTTRRYVFRGEMGTLAEDR